MQKSELSPFCKLMATTCAKDGNCSTRLRRVMNERRRLEMIIWQRAHDAVVVAKRMCVVECTHAHFFRTIVSWVETNFFYNMVEVGPMSAALQKAQQEVAHPYMCSPTCLMLFKDKAARFLTAFMSYAAPVRTLLTQHRDTLNAIKACCNVPFNKELYGCPYDLSMHIFKDVNTRFFHGLFRPRQINTGHHLLTWVRLGTYRKCKMSQYTAWLATDVERKRLDMEYCGHAPPLHEDAPAQDVPCEPPAKEEVGVMFLE